MISNNRDNDFDRNQAIRSSLHEATPSRRCDADREAIPVWKPWETHSQFPHAGNVCGNSTWKSLPFLWLCMKFILMQVSFHTVVSYLCLKQITCFYLCQCVQGLWKKHHNKTQKTSIFYLMFLLNNAALSTTPCTENASVEVWNGLHGERKAARHTELQSVKRGTHFNTPRLEHMPWPTCCQWKPE